jgi:chlorobactene glucosyltransferase
MNSLVVISTAAFFVGLGITYWLHSRYRIDIVVLPVEAWPDKGEMISVVVPARNEARSIQRCVKALLAQDYPDYELIVVDDRSTDTTGEILERIEAESSNLHIVQGVDLPADWAGKPHALVQGVAVARGDWLCFVDADTIADPNMLSAAYRAASEHQADLFSMMTDQELGSFWEKVVLPLVFTGLSFGFPARRVNDPEKPDAIANGQFILIKSAVYQAVGGHTAVRDRIDEDKALAEVVKGAGYRLVLADGRQLARTRMYTSLAEMWEGWTKNIYLGLRDRLWLLTFGAAMGLIGALVLPLWLLAGFLWLAASGGWSAAVVAGEASLLWAYLLWQRARAASAFGISPLYAFTLPLGALVFTAMMFASAYKVISGRGVEWKGRRYR